MLKEVDLNDFSLPSEVSNRLIYKALLTRKVEEQLLHLYAKGELSGTVHTCIGQEFIGAIISEFVKTGDAVFSNHRCHGHFLNITKDVEGLISEIYGKESGVCGGKGGSQHLYKAGFYSNGIQGGIMPVAAGLALAKKASNKGNVSFVFIGDGTLGEGVVYETLNMISKWQLPLVIILENNLYAQSTQQSEVLAGNICARAEAFGIKSARANTWDYENLYWLVDDLVTHTRSSKHPCFLQIDTYRLSSHSKGDDNRDPSEVNHYKTIDPLNILLRDHHGLKVLESKIDDLISDAVAGAQAARPANNHDEYFTPLTWQQTKLAEQASNDIRVSHALNDTFLKLMTQDDRVYFLGEDVRSPYGGAFKISKDLSDFFPERVINTPISEAALVGLANGLALDGYRPIVEIMFGDFITLAMDQIINHAAKFRYMYNNQVRVPLIVRTPMGGGRGYGPTHSQTLDRHLLGTPGLRILAINNLVHPLCLYETLLENSQDPTLVLENKVLYTKMLRTVPPQGFCYKVLEKNFAMVLVQPESMKIDLTIVAYGGLSDLILDVISELFIEHEIIAQFLCPLQIYPFNVDACRDIIDRGNHLVLIEEGQGFANFSAEFLAQYFSVSSKSHLKAIRIAAEDNSIPASKNLENEVLITKDKIIGTILKQLQ